MPSYIETAFNRITRLIDLMGYVLMMVLSLTLWWGIYSGVEITLSADQGQAQATDGNSSTSGTALVYLSQNDAPFQQAP
ncbi:MAG: hypothetical protein AB8B87_09910 [Granulosicoccus sp.]